MENDTNRDNAQQSDISKSQSAQQPQGSQSEKDQGDFAQSQPDSTGQQGSSQGQADYGSAEQADTMTQGRTDVEGSSLEGQDSDSQSGFLGSDSQSDTSSELVEDEDSETPEGK